MGDEMGRITGPNIEHRPEVLEVKEALRKVGLDLECFDITITAVYIKPRPYGFDFICRRHEELQGRVEKLAAFHHDDKSTPGGAFSAGDTHGEGFRQKGFGPGLHIEIGADARCNVHIDSHGYVGLDGQYDWSRSLLHGYWDLAPDEAPWAFGSFGETGQVGPIPPGTPTLGLDDRVNYYWFGLAGHWK
jgi:hypothetical protein